MKLQYNTDNPMEDITSGAFDFFSSPSMKKEANDILVAATNGNMKAFSEALIEYYTSASAYAVAITVERLLTAPQKQELDEAISKRRTEIVDETIAQIFKENNE